MEDKMKRDVKDIYRGMKGILRDEGLLDAIPRGKVINTKNDPKRERKRNKAKKWHIDMEDDV